MNETTHAAVIPHDPNANICDLLEFRLGDTPDLVIFSTPRTDGGWDPMTVREFHDRVVALAKGFVEAGVKPGDKIGIMCRVRFEWTLIDFAVAYAGAMLVPIYETSSPSQIAFVLADSGANAIIVETAEMFTRFDEIRAETPRIKAVWRLDHDDLASLILRGSEVPESEIEKRRNIAQGKDLATLIYTSGSTGKPKGCMLSHANFVDTIRNSASEMHEVIYLGSSTVLFVTTAHVLARVVSMIAVYSGVHVAHQPDTKLLLPSLQSFKPTFLLAVPRVFEKVYNSAEQKAEAGGKGKIFRAATHAAIEYSRALDAGRVSFGLRARFALFDRLVLSKLRHAMGGRVKFAVSGSAPLGTRLGHYFRALGLKVLEGYGLTETTGPVTVNVPSKYKIGSVGPTIPGVDVKIAEDGEILVRGINVFGGYWHNDKATAEVFDGEWFRTGDIGNLDDDGYLWITGRKKEIIVTAGGKNVAPPVLEDPIKANPLVGHCVVVGDAKPFVAALVTLDSEMLPTWLANQKLDSDVTLAQAAEHPAVLAEIQRAIDRANESVSRAESIRKFVVLPIEFSEASGHLTPKMSIKRHVIVQDFSAEVAALYDGNPDTSGLSLAN